MLYARTFSSHVSALSSDLDHRLYAGVSTTAGHDNLYEQSYPIVLNSTMGRLMAAAGVFYEAINVAMGNTKVAPYSLCVDAHAGLEADIISWDMVRDFPVASVVLWCVRVQAERDCVVFESSFKQDFARTILPLLVLLRSSELGEGLSVSIGRRAKHRPLRTFPDWKASGSSALNTPPCIRVLWRGRPNPVL